MHKDKICNRCSNKVKVLFLCVTKHHPMKTQGWTEVQLQALTSALDGSELSNFTLHVHFPPLATEQAAEWVPALVWMFWRTK